MAGIERFEDIDAWKAARELTRHVYAVTREGSFSKDYGLRDQIQRAATSIMANIAEGFDSGSNKEFIRFLGYALRSATEVQSHLCVALDQRYFGEEKFQSSYDLATKVKNLIRGFIRYLRSGPRTPNVERRSIKPGT
jgi:four helix bundle protein